MSRRGRLCANNIARSNQLAEHQKRFEGIDPVEVRRLVEEKALASGQIERVDDNNQRSSLRANDLILSTRGTVGCCAMVTAAVLPANICGCR